MTGFYRDKHPLIIYSGSQFDGNNSVESVGDINASIPSQIGDTAYLVNRRFSPYCYSIIKL